MQWRQSRGAGGNPPLFSTPKKVRGGQILNIVIVVRLEIKNLEESDLLSIKIVNFSDFLPIRNTKTQKESDFLAVKNVESLTFKR